MHTVLPPQLGRAASCSAIQSTTKLCRALTTYHYSCCSCLRRSWAKKSATDSILNRSGLPSARESARGIWRADFGARALAPSRTHARTQELARTRARPTHTPACMHVRTHESKQASTCVCVCGCVGVCMCCGWVGGWVPARAYPCGRACTRVRARARARARA